MSKITTEDLLKQFNQHTVSLAKNPPRPYLGLSAVGDECLRKTFFTWRFAKIQSFPGRILRLFNRGHKEESNFVDLLRGANYKTIEVDIKTGKQFEIVWYDGHVKGHCDGFAFINDEWHLLEMKTANNKSWLKFQRAKDLSVSDYRYYSQMQAYMNGFKVKKGLFMMVNKDNDNIYLEFINYDKGTVSSVKEKCIELCSTTIIPEGCSPSGAYYKCGYCWYKEICFGDEQPESNCRMCQYVELEIKGKWSCKLTKKLLPIVKQRKGCKNFLLLER